MSSVRSRGSAGYSSGGGFQRNIAPSSSAAAKTEPSAAPTALTSLQSPLQPPVLSPHELKSQPALMSANKQGPDTSDESHRLAAVVVPASAPASEQPSSCSALANDPPALSSVHNSAADPARSNDSDDDDPDAGDSYVLSAAEFALAQQLRQEHSARGEQIEQMEQTIQQTHLRMHKMQQSYESLEQQHADDSARLDTR